MGKIAEFFNKRKTTADTPMYSRGVAGRSGGVYVTPDTAMQASAFYSGVLYISTSVAKLPWHIKDSNNKKLDTKVSRLLDLAPNPEVDAMDFRLSLIQTALIHGNSYAEIERNTMGEPVALWFLPPYFIEPARTASTNELYYRVLGGSLSNPGGDAYLPAKDVLHIKNFFLTSDGLGGQGVVAYCRETLGISLGADQFANALFSNGGMPSGVLATDGTISEEAAVRLKESWKTAHSGRKTGGTAVLEEGIKYNPISHDPKVLQFLESREFSVIEIARFLRVPPTKLYVLLAAKFNNIEQENLSVATDTLSSWCKRLELQVDIKLLSNRRGGRKSDLDLNDLFRGDMDTRSQYFSRMMQNAAMTPNQIRIAEGEEPYDGGDEYYIAANNFTPVSRQNEVIDSQIKSKTDPVIEKTEKEKENDDVVAQYLESKIKKLD